MLQEKQAKIIHESTGTKQLEVLYILPIMMTFICPIASVMGPAKTRKGREVTIPTATVQPIIKREDSTGGSIAAYKSSRYLNETKLFDESIIRNVCI